MTIASLRRLALLVGALAFACLLAHAGPAFAQGKVETNARNLQKKAIEDDYLASEFTKAQDRLQRAIGMCGEKKCSAGLRARLRRDLGVVQVGGQLDTEKGITSFVDALKIDASITLDADVRTKDLDAAFAEARKRAGLDAPAAPPTPPAPPPGPPAGDFAHTPAPAHQTRTPIPVYADYTGDQPLTKVTVRYRGFGMTDWKGVDLKRMSEKGWGGTLPCSDVQQGAMTYYVVGFNANNDPVATSGDRNNPYKTTVAKDRPADPPHLPGVAAPSQCSEAQSREVVATFDKGGKDNGEFCEDSSECSSHRCESARCAEPLVEKPKPRRLWFGLAASLDFAFIPSSDDTCKLDESGIPLNDESYYCIGADGTDFPSRDPDLREENLAIIQSSNGGSDRVTGGGALANVRLLLTFDYALTGNILLGGRAGLVLRRYPGVAAENDGQRTPFPIHLEGRITYLFGSSEPLFRAGLAPLVFGAVGLGQYETAVPVQIISRQGTAPPVRQTADAWHIAGPIFFSVGAGARYAFTERLAILGAPKLNLAFGNAFVPSLGLEVGAQYGF